jgi:hypothetical protein
VKYLCLVYHYERAVEAMPEREYAAILEEALDYRDELRESGYYIASSPLQSVFTATTIRVRNGKLSISDGPCAESNEQLGGFYLIEARDLNDAIRVASKMPPARFGSIEIRALHEVASD